MYETQHPAPLANLLAREAQTYEEYPGQKVSLS